MMMMMWVLKLWLNRAGLVSLSEPSMGFFSFCFEIKISVTEFEKAKRRSLKMLLSVVRSVCRRVK